MVLLMIQIPHHFIDVCIYIYMYSIPRVHILLVYEVYVRSYRISAISRSWGGAGNVLPFRFVVGVNGLVLHGLG